MARKQKDKRVGAVVHRSLALGVSEREEGEEPATQRQLAYIRHLAPGIELTEGKLEDLGKWQASKIIDQIKEEKEQLEWDIKREAWAREEQEVEGNNNRRLPRRLIGWLILSGLLALWYYLA